MHPISTPNSQISSLSLQNLKAFSQPDAKVHSEALPIIRSTRRSLSDAPRLIQGAQMQPSSSNLQLVIGKTSIFPRVSPPSALCKSPVEEERESSPDLKQSDEDEIQFKFEEEELNAPVRVSEGVPQ